MALLWNFHARSRTFSVLHYVIKITLCYIASRFILPVKNLELSRTALLCCRLAASRLREAARWQLKSVTEQTITRSPLNTEIYLVGDLL